MTIQFKLDDVISFEQTLMPDGLVRETYILPQDAVTVFLTLEEHHAALEKNNE